MTSPTQAGQSLLVTIVLVLAIIALWAWLAPSFR